MVDLDLVAVVDDDFDPEKAQNPQLLLFAQSSPISAVIDDERMEGIVDA
jgi:hypothetical protein